MNYFAKIFAKPEAEKKDWTYPLPSQLVENEKSRSANIDKMKEIGNPFSFKLLKNREKFEEVAKALTSEKQAMKIGSVLIFDKSLTDRVKNVVSGLGLGSKDYVIEELPEGWQSNPDLFTKKDVAIEDNPLQKEWTELLKQKEETPDTQQDEPIEPTKPMKLDPHVGKIKSMVKPVLIIIDTHNNEKYVQDAQEKHKDVFDKTIIWQYVLDRYLILVCPLADKNAVLSILNRFQMDYAISKKTIPVKMEDPFSKLEINFEKLDSPNEGKIRELLNKNWNQEPSEDDEEDDFFGSDVDTRKGIPPEKFKKIAKMTKPYLLLIQTKIDPAASHAFMKDKEVINLLARGVKYILTKKTAIRSWIIPQALVSKAVDFCKKHRVLYAISELPKGLNDKDQPFAEIKINLGTLGSNVNETDLKNQLNENWIIAAHSIIKKPVLEMNSSVPLDYLRFLNPENKEVGLYLGGHPVDAGTLGICYILIESEEEGVLYKENLEKLRLPEKVYEDMDVVSYLPKGFSGITPKKIKPANCLVLFAKTTFEPNKKKKVAKNKDVLYKKILEEAKKITKDQMDEKALEALIENKLEEYAKKSEKEFSGVGLAKTADPVEQQLEKLFEKHEDDLYDAVHQTEETELDALHAAAKKFMSANVANAGSFVNSDRFIGTHIAHFSSDMKICLLWGTTVGMSVNVNEMLKDLDFVKEIDTTYAG